MNLLQQLEAEQVTALRGSKPHPQFRPGDTVKVSLPSEEKLLTIVSIGNAPA